MTECVVCGDRLDRARGARGRRCATCTRYRQRHGHDRPLALVEKFADRKLQQELEQRPEEPDWMVQGRSNQAGRRRTGVQHWRKKKGK
ncbi:MAG: hypothetical protein ACRDQD_04140 [Nocardioidaceae bacterium]